MIEANSGQHFATRARAEKKSLTFFREAGRGKALVHINNLVKFNPGVVLLMGEAGSGRSRVLKQFADSLKGKPGRICVLDRAIKNDGQLYTALAEGFEIDHIPGDNVRSLQKSVYAFLEANVTTNKPVIIALDDVQLCSLAMLEVLLELQAKFKQMSLVLIGDNSLQKMLQRLQGGKSTANSVLLNALDAREMRQYVNWRLPFQISDIELTNMINLSRGNLGLLEQEAVKKEVSHEQNSSQKSESHLKLSRQSVVRLFSLILIVSVVSISYFLYPEQFSTKRIGDIAGDMKISVSTKLFSQVKELLHLENGKISTPDIIRVPELPVRTNEEWIERQIALLNHNEASDTPSDG